MNPLVKKENIPYWEYNECNTLHDVIVIGSGFVGLSTAIHLKKKSPHLKIAILERDALSTGASARNAGFACFGTIGELEEDLRNMSLESVLSLVKLRYEGLLNLQHLIPVEFMDYEACGGYELFDGEEEFQQCSNRIDFWNSQLKGIIGNEVFQVVEQPLKGFYSHMIYNKYEGSLHPSKALRYLYKQCLQWGVDIWHGMEVKCYDKTNGIITINCSNGMLFSAKNLAFATNGFTHKLWDDLDVQPARNQVIVTNLTHNINIEGCYHYDKGYVYFRNIKEPNGNRILLGGARNISNVEDTSELATTNEIISHLESFMIGRLGFAHAQLEFSWSGILGVGSVKKPIIKKIEEQIFIGVRLGGMGVAIGTKVGEELAELLTRDGV